MGTQPEKKYIRNKTPEDYDREIRATEKKLQGVRDMLGKFLVRMENVQMRYRDERKAILSAEAKRTKRAQGSGLTLYVHTRGRNRSPCADWNKYIRFTKESTKKHRRTFMTPHIRQRGKFGWSICDLGQYAHPKEVELVMEIEAELTALREHVQPYKKSAEQLSKALAQLKRAARKKYPGLSLGANRGEHHARKRKAVDVRQLNVPFPVEIADDAPMPPQFKRPEGVMG